MQETAVPLAIVWQRGELRCEYWKAPGLAGHLKMHVYSTLVRERMVASVDDMRQVGASWRAAIAGLGDLDDSSVTTETRIERIRAALARAEPGPTRP